MKRPFSPFGLFLIRVLPIANHYFNLIIGCWMDFSDCGFWSKLTIKTKHTTRKCIKYCAIKWCLFLYSILFGVNWDFGEMWNILECIGKYDLRDLPLCVRLTRLCVRWIRAGVRGGPASRRPSLGIGPHRFPDHHNRSEKKTGVAGRGRHVQPSHPLPRNKTTNNKSHILIVLNTGFGKQWRHKNTQDYKQPCISYGKIRIFWTKASL